MKQIMSFNEMRSSADTSIAVGRAFHIRHIRAECVSQAVEVKTSSLK
jgi:hypothetical protein